MPVEDRGGGGTSLTCLQGGHSGSSEVEVGGAGSSPRPELGWLKQGNSPGGGRAETQV